MAAIWGDSFYHEDTGVDKEISGVSPLAYSIRGPAPLPKSPGQAASLSETWHLLPLRQHQPRDPTTPAASHPRTGPTHQQVGTSLGPPKTHSQPWDKEPSTSGPAPDPGSPWPCSRPTQGKLLENIVLVTRIENAAGSPKKSPRVWGKIQQEGDICKHIADSFCCTAETNTTL